MAATGVVVARNRVLAAEADDIDARAVNAARDEGILDRLGSLLRECLVELGRADAVGAVRVFLLFYASIP